MFSGSLAHFSCQRMALADLGGVRGLQHPPPPPPPIPTPTLKIEKSFTVILGFRSEKINRKTDVLEAPV